ncbi:MAG: hypothetical protein WCZ87_08080 [Thiohalobacteraceae bacterium]
MAEYIGAAFAVCRDFPFFDGLAGIEKPVLGASSIKETLNNPSFVIPAKAGIQRFKDMDSGLRRNDGKLDSCLK